MPAAAPPGRKEDEQSQEIDPRHRVRSDPPRAQRPLGSPGGPGRAGAARGPGGQWNRTRRRPRELHRGQGFRLSERRQGLVGRFGQCPPDHRRPVLRRRRQPGRDPVGARHRIAPGCRDRTRHGRTRSRSGPAPGRAGTGELPRARRGHAPRTRDTRRNARTRRTRRLPRRGRDRWPHQGHRPGGRDRGPREAWHRAHLRRQRCVSHPGGQGRTLSHGRNRRSGCLGRAARRARRQFAQRGLCEPRHLRDRGPRRIRPLGLEPGIRPGLAADDRGFGLGAVHLRPMGLVGPLGLDLARLLALGLGPVSLWPLGLHGYRMVVGARSDRDHPCLRPGTRRLLRRGMGRRLLLVDRRGHEPVDRLGAPRLGRTLHPLVGRLGRDLRRLPLVGRLGRPLGRERRRHPQPELQLLEPASARHPLRQHPPPRWLQRRRPRFIRKRRAAPRPDRPLRPEPGHADQRPHPGEPRCSEPDARRSPAREPDPRDAAAVERVLPRAPRWRCRWRGDGARGTRPHARSGHGGCASARHGSRGARPDARGGHGGCASARHGSRRARPLCESGGCSGHDITGRSFAARSGHFTRRPDDRCTTGESGNPGRARPHAVRRSYARCSRCRGRRSSPSAAHPQLDAPGLVEQSRHGWPVALRGAAPGHAAYFDRRRRGPAAHALESVDEPGGDRRISLRRAPRLAFRPGRFDGPAWFDPRYGRSAGARNQPNPTGGLGCAQRRIRRIGRKLLARTLRTIAWCDAPDGSRCRGRGNRVRQRPLHFAQRLLGA